MEHFHYSRPGHPLHEHLTTISNPTVSLSIQPFRRSSFWLQTFSMTVTGSVTMPCYAELNISWKDRTSAVLRQGV
jgi:hypothetical protein